ncbi:glycosyltransferase [Novosphingobium sp. 1949]|uniref:Glycosyltransferase n=1 Tax=Novosphingobium organovorum TaxID=2930092 RepID=A0ABT0BEA1_9SPHN|nr:glycosyltransferase [Novosphingobium organovorum]MCJ2183183.1 glycosyltransferase [Novosphingobium organovorum]
MRIAIPIHSLAPGGVERVAIGLACEWDRCGHDVTIVLGRSESAALCSAPALRTWRIPTRFSTASWETPWMVNTLYRYLRTHEVDVLFCPGNTYAIVAAAMKLLRGERTPPLVLKVSNALHRPDMPLPVRRGYGVWLRLQGALFDRLVALSEPMQREIRTLTRARPDRVRTIANPVLARRRLKRLARIAHAPRSVWSMHYLAAGRLVAQKNYPLLLRAFARAARPEDRLTIAGEGPERTAIEQTCRELGIAGQVHLAGHLASIDALLAQADALVLSSDYEGLPGVVVEALAAGLPVLATDCCVSMASLIETGRTGILVPTGAEDAFAQGLLDLRQFEPQPARARACAAAYEIEGAAARYIEMMTELVRTSANENGPKPHDPPSGPARREDDAASTRACRTVAH